MQFWRNLILMSVLALSLGGLSACSSKETIQEPTTPSITDTTMSSVDIAAQTITDGVVYFEFNMYDIKAEYREMLRQKAELMRQYPQIRIRIEGNCDARGTQEYNLALGERRARAAYEYMVMLGVNPAQMDVISYGKERPAVDGTGDRVWSLNRRDDFRVVAR